MCFISRVNISWSYFPFKYIYYISTLFFNGKYSIS